MPSSPLEDRAPFASVRSRLGQSLLRLHETLENRRREDAGDESLLAAWQQKWSARREQISRRLAFIEQQLERYHGPVEPARQFNLVRPPVGHLEN